VNLQVNSTVFSPLSRSFVTNDEVVNTLSAGANAASDVNLARAAMNAGFSLVFLAEYMCSGVIRQGPALTPNQVLDSAIVRFQRAVTVGTAAGGTEGTRIVNASNVGIARAQLQKGDNAAAATTAALVPSTMTDLTVVTIDDAANRGLGNNIFSVTTGRTVSVPARYQITDSRVRWTNTNQPAQDALLTPLVTQQKYTGFASPLRIASYLEARYILAEAQLKQGNSAPAIALIAERSAAGVAGAAATPLSSTTTLGQLMELRAREFWLEGKKLGDIRRNPDAKAYYDAPGTVYYKGTGAFGSDVCFPIPQEETNTNPNLGS
jgi:starch-binding outer membrane protein, SusD/RagB family